MTENWTLTTSSIYQGDQTSHVTTTGNPVPVEVISRKVDPLESLVYTPDQKFRRKYCHQKVN